MKALLRLLLLAQPEVKRRLAQLELPSLQVRPWLLSRRGLPLPWRRQAQLELRSQPEQQEPEQQEPEQQEQLEQEQLEQEQLELQPSVRHSLPEEAAPNQTRRRPGCPWCRRHECRPGTACT